MQLQKNTYLCEAFLQTFCHCSNNAAFIGKGFEIKVFKDASKGQFLKINIKQI